MNQTEELSLVPYIEPKTDVPSPKRPHGRSPLPLILCAAALVFYCAVGASFLRENRKPREYLVRLMIGDIAGGIGNVYALPDIEEIHSYDFYPDESTGDVTLDRLGRLESSGDMLGFTNTETPYVIDMSEILLRPRAIPPLGELTEKHGEDKPVVLIIHTHGTEAYADCAENNYRTKGDGGVIGIGSIIADTLKDAGVGTVHCTVAFDELDFNTAYYSAALAIRDYLREYPSISYVIDVHRDSITLPDGTYYAPMATVGGENAAKLMFVVGTDYAGSGHVGWRDNLALCARVQSSVSDKYEGVMRNINIRAASFNEQYTKGSMLLEVGSCANTFDEAARSAKIFAEALADEIKG